MSKLTNEYEKLLLYLNKNLSETGTKQSVPRQKELKKENHSDSKKQDVELIKQATKKFIEDSQIHSFIPPTENPSFKPNKSLGFDVATFENAMRHKLIEEYKKIQTYERPYISVTEICSCLRAGYYNRLKYKIDLKKKFNFSYLYLIQRVGNEIHDIVQSLYNFNEVEKTIVSELFKVKGRVDGIRDRCLYELKSIDPEKFKGKYIDSHYQQGLIYAYILNTEYDYNIEKIVIVYFMRNLKKVVPFDLSLDNNLAKSLLERAIILKSSIEKNEVPDPIGASKDECHWCLFRQYCQKDECQKIFQPWQKTKKDKPKEKDSSAEIKNNKDEIVFLL